MKAAAVTGLLAASAASGLAETCDAPVIDWQPREALRTLLETAGWHVQAITVRDGCYAVVMVAEGEREITAVFDPQTLQMVDDER